MAVFFISHINKKEALAILLARASGAYLSTFMYS